MTVHPFVASLIRTLVPVVVGTILGWLARVGLGVDSAGTEALGAWFEMLFVSAYYFVFRWLETKFPQVGWFLGLAKSPDSYSAGAPGPRHLGTPAN